MTDETPTIDLALDREAGLYEYTGEYPPKVDVYRAPADKWHLYRTLINKANDVEDEIIASCLIPAAAVLPDDLEALRGILPDEELLAIAKMRLFPLPVVAAETTAEPAAEADDGQATEVITKAPVPPCTRPGAKAGKHTPGRYFLQEDGTIDTQCPCGMVFKNVKCPHRQQMKQGKNIVCSWCHKIIISNTGVPDRPVPSDQLDSMRVVNVDQYKGTVE